MNVKLIIIGLLVGFMISFIYFNFFYEYCGSSGITCVSSPINELVTTMQQAQAGIDEMTNPICMLVGEQYTSDTLMRHIGNVNKIVFRCDGAAACSGYDMLEVKDDYISAKSDLKFKALISCTESNGNYDCKINIQNG